MHVDQQRVEASRDDDSEEGWKAGRCVVCLERRRGEVKWRTMKEGGRVEMGSRASQPLWEGENCGERRSVQ